MVSSVSFHYQNGKLRHPKAGSQLHEFATLQTSEGSHKIEWGCKKQCHSLGPSKACLCWGALLSLMTVLLREPKLQMCPLPALPSHLQRKSLQIKFEKYCGACKKKRTEPTSLKVLTFWRMKEAQNLQHFSPTGTREEKKKKNNNS